MANCRTILNQLTEVPEIVNDVSFIDPVTREITVAPKEGVFGVTGDADSEKKYFAVPRYVSDEFDVAKCENIRVSYIAVADDGTSYRDTHISTDFAYNDKWYVFSWLLSRNACQYVGMISFSINFIILDTNANIKNQWDTAIAYGKIVKGIVNAVSDEEAETIRDAIASVTASIPKDYSSLSNDVRLLRTDVDALMGGGVSGGTTIYDAKTVKVSDIDNAISKNILFAIKDNERVYMYWGSSTYTHYFISPSLGYAAMAHVNRTTGEITYNNSGSYVNVYNYGEEYSEYIEDAYIANISVCHYREGDKQINAVYTRTDGTCVYFNTLVGSEIIEFKYDWSTSTWSKRTIPLYDYRISWGVSGDYDTVYLYKLENGKEVRLQYSYSDWSNLFEYGTTYKKEITYVGRHGWNFMFMKMTSPGVIRVYDIDENAKFTTYEYVLAGGVVND